MKNTQTNWLAYYYRIKKNRNLRVLSLGLMVVGGVLLIGWLIPAMFGYLPVPTFFNLLGIDIRIYTVLVLLGMLAALYMFEYLQLDHKDLRKVDPWSALVYILIPGVVFARLYYVVTEISRFGGDWLSALTISSGGLSIIGGFLGGAIGIYFYGRRNKIPLMPMLSAAAVVMPLAQAIGRFGNLFNKELFGFPTDLPWGMYVPPLYRPITYLNEQYYHPLFLYEAIPNMLLFIGMIAYWKYLRPNKARFDKALRMGLFVRIYLAAYMSIRFILDFYRLDGGVRYYGFTVTQLLLVAVLLAIIVYGVGFQLWFKYKRGIWFTDHNQLLKK